MLNNKNLLKNLGFKITPTRLAVLEIFNKNDKPIDANFIHRKLKESINEATIYRTLTSFEKSGILRKVDLRKESIYFELNNDHHHHIVCTKCGQIEDFKESKDIERLLNQIVEKSAKFKNIKEHSLELFGFCKICS